MKSLCVLLSLACLTTHAVDAVDISVRLRTVDKAELVLNQVHFQGRVFDPGMGRLPDDGIGISGNVPLNVVVRQGTQSELDVQFTLPTHYFDGIDWSA